ncbi:MAG: NAD-dependent epimerase/dehydratase family protein [Deltaproteobacteria bacterium]|nr:NAD-dependent epimerase/dehydratase family protein [Deltaproteobacteria bacterium]
MNVLITGANGFIGRALCSRLASDNKVVRLIL